MKLAGLSFDMDSVASHLEGYGYPRPEDDGSAYRIALPRILELLARTGSRATFFLIADEARHHPDAVRRIAAEGHEVASHSMTHRLPFRDLSEETRRQEIWGSKVLLEALADREVTGFRAPSWDVGAWLAGELVDAGYQYDSSAYPSVLLLFLRAAVARRGNRSDRRFGAPVWPAIRGPRSLHRIETQFGSLVEVPMYTVPGARLPYYHTLRLVAPDWLNRWIRRRAQARPEPVWYQFHAADFLSLSTDDIDGRIACHPGMKMSLERKLELAEESVRELGQGRVVVPLGDLVTHRFDALVPSVVMTARGHNE